MKTIKLGVSDRFNIQTLLPVAGNRIQMMLARSIISQTDFTPEEVRDFQIKTKSDGTVTFNPKSEEFIEFILTEEVKDLLRPGISEVDESGQVTLPMLSLIDKIESE